MNAKKMIFAASLSLASMLCGAMPAKSAHAGVILMAYGLNHEHWDAVTGSFVKGPLATATGVLSTGAGIWLGIIGGFGLLGPALLFFDADGSIPQGALERSLVAKYAFLDPHSCSGLASLIKSKAQALAPKEGQVMISISSEEIDVILEPTDLLEVRPDEVAQLKKDLG